MREREHLTKNQIAGYRAGAFDAREASEIGRHLLKCESCRRSLPAPTFDDFWNAVMNERETERNSTFEESELSRHTMFSYFPKVFGQFSGLAWSGAVLILLVSFSLLLWLNAANRRNQKSEVAQTFNSEKNDFNAAQIDSSGRIALPPQNSNGDGQIDTPSANRHVNSRSQPASVEPNILNLSSEEKASRNSTGKIPKDESSNISSTRGGVLPTDCGSETSVETDIGLNGEAVTLKWKKIPNAVKYHLYVSDDEEILIDEFETERETSYTVKKSLDAAKTYNWKVVVTTEDGKTIVGNSRKFTIKSLQLNRNESEKKEKRQIRCSQTN